MRRVNYNSDFTVRLTPTDAYGNEQILPDYDFDLVFTCGGHEYVCSRKGGEYCRCKEDDGNIVCIFDNHGLLPGVLYLTARFYSPNTLFPDGTQLLTTAQRALSVELVRCDEDDATDFDAEVTMPYAIITAYQMAVSAGYTGTEQEWLDMMMGATKIDIRQSEGDSTTAVMSQKATTDALSERDAALQEYIDKMRAELLEVYCMILVGDNPVLVGGENTYTIQAQATETPDTLTISRNGTVIASTTESKTLVFGETPALTERGTITYSVEAKIGATTKRAEAKINVVLPIYLGAGAAARDIMTDDNKLSARTEPKGVYTITVQTKGDYVWLILPDDMEFKGAELGGFQFPMSKKDVYVKDYNVYRSDLAYLTGDMEITLL